MMLSEQLADCKLLIHNPAFRIETKTCILFEAKIKSEQAPALIKSVEKHQFLHSLMFLATFGHSSLTEGDLTDFLSTSTPCWPCRQAVSFLCVLWETCLTNSSRFSTWNKHTAIQKTHIRTTRVWPRSWWYKENGMIYINLDTVAVFMLAYKHHYCTCA